VTFTFGGRAYLWGYTDDRSQCGIWSVADLAAPPQMWPIGEQGEAWTRFWALDPDAVEFREPTPPPPPSATPWSSSPAPSSGMTPGAYGGGSPYGSYPSYPSYPSGGPEASMGPSLPAKGDVYPTRGSADDDPHWRLILVQGAKPLLVVFIVVGVVIGVANVAAQIGHNPLQRFAARVQVESDYDTLNSAVVSYETDTKACQGSLVCVTGTDRTLAQAFGTFVVKLDGISMPSDTASATSALSSEASHCEAIFTELGAASSITQYEETLQANNQVLSQFDQDYQNLLDQLN
jgi:hypothetical protein